MTQAGSKDRQAFAQPPRRHAGLVDARVVAGDGSGEVALEVTRPPGQ
jgi:hypothetical protein